MGALGDLSGLRADGVEFPIEASISQVEVAGQQHFTVILRDVTERRRMEDQLRDLITRLERNNRELQDFAYVASHDLQEPLRKIQAFGDRLKVQSAAALDEKGLDYLGRMQAAAGRMQTLINDLLTFSRVTTKAQPFARTDLAQVTRDVLADLEVLLEKSGGQVTVGELPVVDADPTQMRQVLQNLIGNALKFHRPDAPPRVQVSAVIDGEVCQVVVADNGIGFDEKYLDRIFTPFQRLHGRGVYEGTGIGLAVVRKIVERHGGAVTARSAPGSGANFIVTLPVRQADQAAAAREMALTEVDRR
jgi:light-regulated signal transduction histidine kinase (bacteriophytochrome)